MNKFSNGKSRLTITSAQTEDELNTLVDAGITVKNVTVEHPIYGEITANIMVKNRYDVEQFMKRLQEKMRAL